MWWVRLPWEAGVWKVVTLDKGLKSGDWVMTSEGSAIAVVPVQHGVPLQKQFEWKG